MFYPFDEDDELCTPSQNAFDAFESAERDTDGILIRRAEALTAVLVEHLTPVPSDSEGARVVYTSHVNEMPLMSGSAGANDDVDLCVMSPSGAVFSVTAIECAVESLPSATTGVLARAMDCTGSQVTSRVRKVVTAVLLMPKLWSLVKQGVVTFERLIYTVGRATSAGVCIPEFDRLLTRQRVDVSVTTFRRHVREVIALLATPDVRRDAAIRERTVRYVSHGNGTATVSVTGPVLWVHAYFQRIRGCARAIKKGAIDSFGVCTDKHGKNILVDERGEVIALTDEPANVLGQPFTDAGGITGESEEGDPELTVADLGLAGAEVDDDRGLGQVMFDTVVGARLSTTVQIQVKSTGKHKPAYVETCEPRSRVIGCSGGVGAFRDRWESEEAQKVATTELCLLMPTHLEWLKNQASVNLTVPLMHFLPAAGEAPSGGTKKPPGSARPPDSNGTGVPIMVNGVEPIDAYTADEVLTQVSWVYRMFTDPRSGVVLESAPTKYRVTEPLKRVLEARWVTCSVPWCSTPARVCEKDHIVPFNHQDPKAGGLTELENLHPLCKRHHQDKTEGRICVARRSDGALEWEFPRIGTVLVYPPESRINQQHYERLVEYVSAGHVITPNEMQDTVAQTYTSVKEQLDPADDPPPF